MIRISILLFSAGIMYAACCQPGALSTDDKMIKKTRLYQDMYQGSRDAIYRAASFIAKEGGPPPDETTQKALAAHRTRAAKWLKSQSDIEALDMRYIEFTERWSPVFPD